MPARIPAHVREQQINDLPNISFVRWADGYQGNISKAICRCGVDGFEWEASVTALLNAGSGCHQCAGNRRRTAEERIAQINAKPNITFVRWANEYAGVNSKAICRCAVDGFEWPATIKSLLYGRGCPQCAGNRCYSAVEREQQINTLPNIEFVRWLDTYRNSKSKAVVHCLIDNYEWSAGIMDLIVGGYGCPQCAGVRRWTAEERIAQINERPNISFVGWETTYTNSDSKAICRCEIDGFEWSTSVNNLANARTGCPQCARVRRWTAEERVAQINALPDIKFVRWGTGRKDKKAKAICRCDIDGFEWAATVDSLLNNGTGCPQCAGVRRWTEEENIERINARPNIQFVRWGAGYRSHRSKAICRCLIDGFEWTTTVNRLLTVNGSGCPQCARSGYNPAKAGTLYILRSECGAMVKIGISNNHEQRHGQLRRATPFDWSCIELLHSTDGSLIAEFEKELHSWTEPAEFREPFDGYTEWRKWDDRLPRWVERYRARLARIVAP